MQPRTLADRPRLHTLTVGETDRQRRRSVSQWVGDELAHGAKVLYKGWLDDAPGPSGHWLLGPSGARGARDALTTGQLEFMDIPTLAELTGATARGLLELHHQEARTALREGYARIAMSGESPRRAMGPGEADELAAHERGLTDIVSSWPVTVLCQLSVVQENQASIVETVGAHHRDLVDGDWAASEVDGVWCLCGDLDAYVARRFAAALRAALRDDTPRGGHPDLHVDLTRVEFMDVACATMLGLAAQSADRDRRIVLHRPALIVRRLLHAVGLPRSVVLDEAAT